MFRRRRRQSAAEAVEESTPASVEVDADDDRPAEPPRPQGPWDAADAPEDQPGAQRLDLGGIRVPVLPDLELRIDMDAAQKPVAATVVNGPSAMQVNAFAAPRTEGIWGEVRAEILASLQAGGAREVEGPFGPEVLSKVPAGPPVPGRGTPVVDARFIGVDGPRWFLRALVSGPAATDRALAAPFEEVLRGVIVVRGGEAMPPREPLPLVLPRQVQEAAAAHAEQQSQAQQEAQAQALAQQQQAQQQAGPGRTASRRVSGAHDQPGAKSREPSGSAAGSAAPTPKLSMADQLARAARAVAARQTGAPTGSAQGSTAPAPVADAPAPAAAPPSPAHEPTAAPGDQESAAPASEPPTPAGPASSEPDLGVLDAPPTAGGGLDPAGGPVGPRP